MGNCLKAKSDLKYASKSAMLSQFSEISRPSPPSKKFELPIGEDDSFSCLHMHNEKMLGAYSKNIYVYNYESGKIIGTYTKHLRMVNQITTISNTTVASAGYDTNINIWDPNSSDASISTFSAHKYAVTSIVPITPQLLVSGSKDYCVKTWDIILSKQIAQKRIENNIVTAMAYHRSHNLILQCSEDLSIKMYDTNLNIITPIKSGSSFAVCIDIDPSENYFVTGHKGFISEQSVIKLWDIRNHETPVELMTLNKHKQNVVKCNFVTIKEKLYCLSASNDGTCVLFDCTNGETIQCYLGCMMITTMQSFKKEDTNYMVISHNSPSLEEFTFDLSKGFYMVGKS
jgi:WD40 repeat protein